MTNVDRTYLRLEKITKIFPGTVALDEINFDLRKGEVHSIVGENGAGKSTLMKILSGAYKKTSGKIFIDNKEVDINSIADSQHHGINMIYQELSNLPKLSVAENIFLGILPKKNRFGVVDFNELFRHTKEHFDNYKIDINPHSKLANLSVAEKQFVEIMRVVTARDAQIIIMDEPTSSLTKEEIEKLFGIIEVLKKRDITVIYISHRLDEVAEIADRVSVFRDGKNRGTLEKGNFDQDKIITLMLGHSLVKTAKSKLDREEVIFEVRNLNIFKRITNFNMKLYKGEILGIAGLIGSGKDELVKCLFGLWPAISKEIYYQGTEIKIKSPLDAIRHGIVYLPEERKLTSLFHGLSVKYNISLIWLFNQHNKRIFNKKEEALLANNFIEQLGIKTSFAGEMIDNLSGGNQQKAIFSRLLAVKPDLMILNDPTRGIDVGSKEEIYKNIRELAGQGTSMIIVTSEIEELSYLADRVIVLSKGETRGEFADEDVDLKNMLTCAVGSKK